MQMQNKDEDFKYLYGYQMRDSEIGINIEKLWKDTKGRGLNKEKNFINNFSKVVTHEELHREVFYSLLDLYEEAEEVIVDTISGSCRLALK